jgi:cell division protein FtsI/penicillin-binding protein 2
MEKFVIIRPSQLRRLAFMLTLLLAAFTGLGYRLVDLQWLRHDELSTLAEKRQSTILRPSRRGDILDARGNVLATSLFVKTVCADPSLMGTNQAIVARALAPLLEMSEAELVKRLQPRSWVNEKGEDVDDRYVLLKRKVSVDDWKRIQEAMKNLSFGVNEKRLSRRDRAFYRSLRQNAVFVEPVDDQLRVYPNANLAAHVLGFVGATERRVDHRVIYDVAGRDGVELTFDKVLNGTVGWRQTEVAPGRGELVVFREQDVEARPGLNVVMTLDAGLQNIVESEIAEAWAQHQPVSISSIVVRPRTGEILAMANLPGYDPNRPGGPMANLRNRAIADIAEPGSTFKIVVVSGALNEGLVSLPDPFDCEQGVFRFRGQTLHDHHPYGALSVENVIARSSNIGAAKIGIRLGEGNLYRYIRGFGFGESTAIALPGEVRGRVHPTNQWSKISVAWIPMGHEVAATPLQMVMAMSAIANGGRLMRPLLVDRLEDQDHHVVLKYQPQMVRQVVSESTSRLMVQALKSAVSTNGTGQRAQLDYYRVAGKTGTAQKIENGAYSHTKHYSSFIGFFPADQPELCISVVIDEPKKGSYGGETAAPVFHRIADRAAMYFGIRPDFPPPSDLVPAGSDSLLEAGAARALTAAQTGRHFSRANATETVDQ